MNWQELQALVDTATASLKAYRGSLRWLRPHTLDADASRHVEGLKAESEVMRRLLRSPAEKTRILGEVRAEAEAERRLAGGVARSKARGVREVVSQGRAAIAKARRDPLVSMPDCLDHLDPSGMIQLAHLEIVMEPVLVAANQARRREIYEAALQRQDARGYVEVSIIERLDGNGKPLREVIEAAQQRRVPEGLPEQLDQLERESSRLESRADLLSLQPVDEDRDPAAAEVHAALLDAMTAAGAATDADDQKALREQVSA